MKTYWGKQMLLGLALAFLSGCVTYPIAKNLQQQARPLTLSEVVENPGANQGTVVIWGGRIIKTVNDVSNSALYILKLPLDRSGEPVPRANTSGRFIANSREFLDPEVYKSGRLVTVAGAIAGLESQPVQKANYNYPVVAIKQIHLWPVERRYYYYYYPYSYHYPRWYWGGYYPGWYWGPGWGIGWNWYYGGHWNRNRAYYYHSGGGHWDRSGHGGTYHYQGTGRGGGHYHR